MAHRNTETGRQCNPGAQWSFASNRRVRTGPFYVVIPAYAGIQSCTSLDPVCHPNAAAALGTPACAGVTKTRFNR